MVLLLKLFITIVPAKKGTINKAGATPQDMYRPIMYRMLRRIIGLKRKNE